jgi:type VI secretion system secreted protein VgrG
MAQQSHNVLGLGVSCNVVVLIGNNSFTERSLQCSNDQVVEVAKTAKFKADERKADIAKGETVNAKTITLSADSKIILQVGSSKIELTSSGIKISATKVDIKAKSGLTAKSNGTVAVSGTSTKIEAKAKLDVKGAMVNVTGQAQTKISGAMAEVSGSGMLTLKGCITMIN